MMGYDLHNWTPIGEAESFRHNLKTTPQSARALIRVALFKADPALREAVDEDVQALALAAFKARQFADMADLTRAGYSEDVARHFVERLTIGRRSTATRFVEHDVNSEGETA